MIYSLTWKSINGIAPSREDDDILQQTSCLIAYNYSQHLAINYFAYKTIDLNLPASDREKNTSQIGTTWSTYSFPKKIYSLSKLNIFSINMKVSFLLLSCVRGKQAGRLNIKNNKILFMNFHIFTSN